jgi:hypothetical protein
MDSELESMLDRADELLGDLEDEYNDCLKTQKVSERAKNLAPEIVVKLRSALDHTMIRAWDKYVSPNLSEQDRSRTRKHVYFPITSDSDSFRSRLGEGRMSDLDKVHKKLYDFLLMKQPFSAKENRWLDLLTKIAAEGKHIRLTPQKLTEKMKRITVSSPSGAVSWDASSVRFGAGVAIMGAPVDPVTQRVVPTRGVVERVDILVAFVFDTYGVDVLAFCKEACQKTRALIEEMVII